MSKWTPLTADDMRRMGARPVPTQAGDTRTYTFRV